LSDIGVRVAATAELGEGDMKCVVVKSKEILLVRTNGEIFALDAICNHGLAYLEEGTLEDFNIVCPLHGGSFDVRTGAPTAAPVVTPLGTYPVRVQGGEIFVAITD